MPAASCRSLPTIALVMMQITISISFSRVPTAKGDDDDDDDRIPFAAQICAQTSHEALCLDILRNGGGNITTASQVQALFLRYGQTKALALVSRMHSMVVLMKTGARNRPGETIFVNCKKLCEKSAAQYEKAYAANAAGDCKKVEKKLTKVLGNARACRVGMEALIEPYNRAEPPLHRETLDLKNVALLNLEIVKIQRNELGDSEQVTTTCCWS